MSSTAREERWPSAPMEWASRLIPGHAISRSDRDVRRVVGSPLLYSNDGDRSRARDREWSSIRDLLLPDPISVAGRWQLGVEIVSDFAVTLAIWASVAVAITLPTQHDVLRNLLAVTSRSVGFSFVFAALVTLLGHSEGLYQAGLPRQQIPPSWILAKSVAWAAMIVGVASGLSKWVLVPWPGFLAGTILTFIALNARRQWRIRQKIKQRSSRPLNVLIVGSGSTGRAVEHYLDEHPELGRVVRGFLDDRVQRDFGVLGAIKDLAKVARAEFADELIVIASQSATTNDPQFIESIVSEARMHHLDVRIVPEFPGLGTECGWIETWGEIPVVAVHRESLPHGALLIKRGADIIVGGLALILMSPIMAAIAAFIFVDSGLPFLYRAERVGRKSRRFRCIKFRTMLRNADAGRERLRAQNERQGPCFKIAEDPRITGVGRWLRRYSLDELPQLWNVLCGDMSLVGPRPHPPDDFARYELHHLRRLDVTPGITGLWQITARQNPSFDANLALDLEYIRQWTLGLDLQILLRTIGVVLRGTGD